MTQSFDELFAPKAMSLDELFAAIRPPPLLPVSYPPSNNSDFTSPSSASGANMPQPMPLDRLWGGGVPPAPLNYPDTGSSSGYAAAPDQAPTPLGQYASNDRSIPEQFRMVTSPSGRDFIRGREGPSTPQTYPDIANHPTIGFGHKLTPGDTWLHQQFPNGIDKLMTDTLFNQDLQNAEDAVYHAVGNVEGLSQNQFDSLVSFAFNVGRGNLANSTLAQKIKNRDLAGAANEFSKWVYAGGAKSPGLMDRRAREEALFRRGIY